MGAAHTNNPLLHDALTQASAPERVETINLANCGLQFKREERDLALLLDAQMFPALRALDLSFNTMSGPRCAAWVRALLMARPQLVVHAHDTEFREWPFCDKWLSELPAGVAVRFVLDRPL